MARRPNEAVHRVDDGGDLDFLMSGCRAADPGEPLIRRRISFG